MHVLLAVDQHLQLQLEVDQQTVCVNFQNSQYPVDPTKFQGCEEINI